MSTPDRRFLLFDSTPINTYQSWVEGEDTLSAM